MTSKSIRALFWKEFRQQYLLWSVLFVFCVISQMMACFTVLMSKNQVQLSYGGIAMVFIYLYLVAATSILFCNEHEERTYQFLRALPIPGSAILVGKLGWLFCSTILLTLLLVLESLIWYGITGFSEWSLPTVNRQNIIEIGTVALFFVEAFCWGIFWTTRVRNQMLSFILTATSMFAVMGLTMYLCEAFFSWSNPEQFVPEWTLLRFLIAVPIGGIGLWSAWGWISVRPRTSIFFTAAPPRILTAGEKAKVLAAPKRGEFRWLLWQTWRQSRPMLLYGLFLALSAYVVFFGLVFGSYFGWESILENNATIIHSLSKFFMPVIIVWYILLWATPIIFCGSIFSQDHRKQMFSILTHRGIAPGKIWWSRVLVFGGVYFLPPIAMGITLAMVYLLNMTPDSRFASPDGVMIVGAMFLAYFSVFCAGLMMSMYIRGMVVAIFGTAIVGIFLYTTAMGTFFLLELSPYWTVLPILFAFVLASRLRMGDWLRGRNGFRSHLKSLSPIFIVGLVMMVAIPLIRVYSVPMISMGYHLYQPAAITPREKLTYRGKYDVAYFDKAIASHIENIAKGPVMEKDWIELQMLMNLPNCRTHFVAPYEVENLYYQRTREFVLSAGAAPEYLRETIRFIESIPGRRTPLKDVAKHYYIAQIADLEDGVYFSGLNSPQASSNGLWTYRVPTPENLPSIFGWFMPWEKYRTKRELNNQFQMDAYYLDQIEQFVYNDKSGNFRDLIDEIHVSEKQRNDDMSNRSGSSMMLHAYFDGNVPKSPTRYTEVEIERRAVLIACALHLWWLEHDHQLPETLSQLDGTYLTELPRVPYTRQAFGYIPNPEKYAPTNQMGNVVQIFSNHYDEEGNSRPSYSGATEGMGAMGGGAPPTASGVETIGEGMVFTPQHNPRSRTPLLYADYEGWNFIPLTFAAPMDESNE